MYNVLLLLCFMQFSAILHYMNSLGVHDEATGGLDQSVKGLPLAVHTEKMQEIKEIVSGN